MQNSVALIAAIEGNDNNLNTALGITTIPRKYEEEAVVCFQAWRRNGGELADIPIYAMCPTGNGVSEATEKQLADLGVTYINEYAPITKTFTSGFMNIPYVGMRFEQTLIEDVLIKIDLDMNLLQPLPPEFISTTTILCGQYDDYCFKQQRSVPDGWHNPLDTGFVISPRTSKFYHTLFDMCQARIAGTVIDPIWEVVKQTTGEYYLEEHVADVMYNTNILPITPIQRYQAGEWYTPISLFSDEEIDKIYFWHEHLIPDPNYDKVRQRVEYFNRKRKLAK